MNFSFILELTMTNRRKETKVAKQRERSWVHAMLTNYVCWSFTLDSRERENVNGKCEANTIEVLIEHMRQRQMPTHRIYGIFHMLRVIRNYLLGLDYSEFS